MRILVVDDDHDCADSYELLLTLWGHSVACAYDGPSALTAISGNNYDVVLLDLALPGMSGLQVAKEMRSRQRDGTMVLVALTGYGRSEDHLHTKQAGFDCHLVKPVPPDALKELLGVLASSDQKTTSTPQAPYLTCAFGEHARVEPDSWVPAPR